MVEMWNPPKSAVHSRGWVHGLNSCRPPVPQRPGAPSDSSSESSRFDASNHLDPAWWDDRAKAPEGGSDARSSDKEDEGANEAVHGEGSDEGIVSHLW